MASNPSTMDDPINPEHYKFRGGIETIDYIECVCRDIPGDEAVHVANIIKYVSRYRSKRDGLPPSKHIEKCKWYLERLIDRCKEKEEEA